MIFLTLDTGRSTNPSPRVPSTEVFLSLTAEEALLRSDDFIEPNKPEPWTID